MNELLRAESEERSVKEKYQVELPTWTGPYDILLQVIEEQNLNLLDLDIAVLLDHYLIYLQNLPSIDLDETGEFLVVAATLAQIKSKLLLPDDQKEEEEEKDPRQDLVRYLLEYQKIKQAAEKLREQPLLGRDVFIKGLKETFQGSLDEGRGNLFHLVRGFQRAMQEVKASTPLQFQREEVSVSERMREVCEVTQDQGSVEFESLLDKNRGKNFLIVTFLVVLEMVRLKKMKILVAEERVVLEWIPGATMDLLKSEFEEPVQELIQEGTS